MARPRAIKATNITNYALFFLIIAEYFVLDRAIGFPRQTVRSNGFVQKYQR